MNRPAKNAATRALISGAIERLIAILDNIDGDPDYEIDTDAEEDREMDCVPPADRERIPPKRIRWRR